jgi:hypothetical protein
MYALRSENQALQQKLKNTLLQLHIYENVSGYEDGELLSLNELKQKYAHLLALSRKRDSECSSLRKEVEELQALALEVSIPAFNRTI